jgi:site-specific DNA recombinase
MLQSYEKEQKSLTQEVEENRQTLQNAEQRVMDLKLVLLALREMTDIKELTPYACQFAD